MSSLQVSGLPIDRDTVEELKEKLLVLPVENEVENEVGNEGEDEEEVEDEGSEVLESEYTSNDEGSDKIINTDDDESSFEQVIFFLEGIGMKKYIAKFKRENVDLNTFLSLTEKDLEELGIKNKKDKKIIMNHLGNQKEITQKFVVDENHTSDFQILRNVQTHLTLLQNYCGYVECEMRKKKLSDYNISPTETAMTYFNKFARAALKQTEIISNLLYQKDSSDNLLGKILENGKLTLPEDMREKLVTKKIEKKKFSTRRLVGFVGFSVVLIYGARKLLKKVIN